MSKSGIEGAVRSAIEEAQEEIREVLTALSDEGMDDYAEQLEAAVSSLSNACTTLDNSSLANRIAAI